MPMKLSLGFQNVVATLKYTVWSMDTYSFYFSVWVSLAFFHQKWKDIRKVHELYQQKLKVLSDTVTMVYVLCNTMKWNLIG